MRRFTILQGNSPIKQQVIRLAGRIADHTNVRLVYYGAQKQKWALDVKVFGFEAEVDYFAFMLTSLLSQMANEMEPKPTDDMDDFEKIALVRGAGVPWPRVFEICGWDVTKGNKLMNAWRKEHPEVRYVIPATYIRSFADG
jgi:hypothetical protein